jgi:hypothetical protein
MLGGYKDFIESELGNIRLAGLWKPERVLDTPQRPEAEEGPHEGGRLRHAGWRDRVPP